MRTRDSLSLPAALPMPLRDAVRGVAGIASLGGEALRGATALLPPPVEAALRRVKGNLETAAARLARPALDPGSVQAAARYLDGAEGGDAAAFVRAAAFGWERLATLHGNSREILSETVAATRLMIAAPREPDAAPGRHAAAVLSGLRRSAAIGRPPGLPPQRSPAEQAEVDANLFALCLWLLAARPEEAGGATGPEAEAALLDLATVLTEAHRAELRAAIDDPAALTALLASLAAQL